MTGFLTVWVLPPLSRLLAVTVSPGSYEAFVVYCFLTLVLEYAGGDA